MNRGGLIFLLMAWGGIITLNIFAFKKILGKKQWSVASDQ